MDVGVTTDERVDEARHARDAGTFEHHGVLDLGIGDLATRRHRCERSDVAVRERRAGADDGGSAHVAVDELGAGLDDDPAVDLDWPRRVRRRCGLRAPRAPGGCDSSSGSFLPVSSHQPSSRSWRTRWPCSMSHWMASVISSSPRVGRLDAGDRFVDELREEVDADEREVRRRIGRLLDETDDVAVLVDGGDAEAVRVGHRAQQDLRRRRRRAAVELELVGDASVLVEAGDEVDEALLQHVVAEVHHEVVVAEEVAGDEHAVGQAERLVLRDVGDLGAEVRAVADGLTHLGPGLAGDDADVGDAGLDHVLDAVEEDGLVGDRHQLLGARVRNGAQACARAAGKNQALHKANGLAAAIRPGQMEVHLDGPARDRPVGTEERGDGLQHGRRLEIAGVELDGEVVGVRAVGGDTAGLHGAPTLPQPRAMADDPPHRTPSLRQPPLRSGQRPHRDFLRDEQRGEGQQAACRPEGEHADQAVPVEEVELRRVAPELVAVPHHGAGHEDHGTAGLPAAEREVGVLLVGEELALEASELPVELQRHRHARATGGEHVATDRMATGRLVERPRPAEAEEVDLVAGRVEVVRPVGETHARGGDAGGAAGRVAQFVRQGAEAAGIDDRVRVDEGDDLTHGDSRTVGAAAREAGVGAGPHDGHALHRLEPVDGAVGAPVVDEDHLDDLAGTGQRRGDGVLQPRFGAVRDGDHGERHGGCGHPPTVATASRLLRHHPEACVTDLLILIPALNEEETIGSVVGKARSALDGDVLVIDDGSSDHTARRALAAGARVLQHPFNLGVGAAIRSGIRYANQEGYERVVQIDADGQHEPSEAKRLLSRLADGFDLVVGSRFGGDDPTPYEVGLARRTSMRLLARVASRQTSAKITDATSGFRAFGPAALELFGTYYPTAYLSDTVEALLIGGGAGLRICEEPVQMHQRQGGTPSARPLRSLIYLVRLNLVILVHPTRRPPSSRAGLT